MTGPILVVSWTIPPEPTGSAVIVGNLAQQFTADEMVIAGERPVGRPDGGWQPGWARRVFIVRGWPAGWRGARWWRRLQLPLLVWRCWRLARRHRCTRVIAVFPREEFLLAGYLAARWTGADFYPYMHNTWLENRSGLALRIARWLQPKVFAHARHVFVMSEGMAELYRERYPGLACSALVHSFNEPVPEFSPPPPPGSPLRVAFCGNVNESCADALARATAALFAQGDVEMTILTGTPASQLARLGLIREGVACLTVSRIEVLGHLRKADLVLLPHGFTGGCSPEEYQTIFPTKTIEYLLCGRPILAHSPPGCFLTRFLRAHDCALIVDRVSEAAVSKAVQQLRTDTELRARLVRNALATAKQFRGPRVAGELRDVLQSSDRRS